jgi:N-acetyl-alpha-D-muramate 1-phosphate uridylyltransferase
VVNADIFSEIDFGHLTQSLSVTDMAHLVMVDNPPQHPTCDFGLQAGKLKEGGEAKLTFSGVGVYSPTLFKNIPKGKSAKLAPLLKLAMADDLVTGEHYQGVWHDIGTPDRLKQVDAMLNQ